MIARLAQRQLELMLAVRRAHDDDKLEINQRVQALQGFQALVVHYADDLVRMAQQVFLAQSAIKQFACPQCGPGVASDEDGQCATCGATLCGDWVTVLQYELAQAKEGLERTGDGLIAASGNIVEFDRTIYLYPTVVQCINRDPLTRWYLCVPTPSGRKHVSTTPLDTRQDDEWFKRITAEDHAGLCLKGRKAAMR